MKAPTASQRELKRLRNARYRAKHRDQLAESNREYRRTHVESIRERERRYRAGHRRGDERHAIVEAKPPAWNAVSVRYQCPDCGGPHARQACERSYEVAA